MGALFFFLGVFLAEAGSRDDRLQIEAEVEKKKKTDNHVWSRANINPPSLHPDQRGRRRGSVTSNALTADPL